MGVKWVFWLLGQLCLKGGEGTLTRWTCKGLLAEELFFQTTKHQNPTIFFLLRHLWSWVWPLKKKKKQHNLCYLTDLTVVYSGNVSTAMLITFPSSTRRWRLNTSLLQNAACCNQFREVWQEFLLVNKGSVSDHLLYDATKGFISNTSISFALHDQFRACSRVAKLPKLHVFLQNEIKKWSSMITFKRYPSLLRCIQTENKTIFRRWNDCILHVSGREHICMSYNFFFF